MARVQKRSQRLNDILHLLRQNQQGLSKAELAERLGVDRSTIHRDIEDLEADGVPIAETEYGHFSLDPGYSLFNLNLDATESLVLYLAARRVARQSSRAITPIVSALEKLSAALRQPMLQQLRGTTEHTWELPPDEGRRQILETLTRGWIEKVRVRIWHRALHSVQVQTYLVSPYLFEPLLWGEGTYLIGDSDYHKGVATFKVERIERAVLSTEHFELPTDFDGNDLLKQAWGIWYSEEPAVHIVLRFSARAARRVRENRWHPGEQIIDLSDGGIEWSADVAEPQEMIPWIRGWGADVEVIEPPEVRAQIIAEIKRLASRYDLHPATDQAPSDEFGLDDTFSKYFGD